MSTEHGYHGNTENHLARLRRIEGQVRGLQRMISQGEYCIDILTQVSAVQSALDSVAVNLLKDHMNHCVVTAARESDEAAQAKVDEAAAAIARLIKSYSHEETATTEIDRTIELSVDGMTCGHCVMSVSEELREVPGVKNVEVILNSGATSKVTVLTDTPLDDAALSDAVSEAGFTLVGISRDF